MLSMMSGPSKATDSRTGVSCGTAKKRCFRKECNEAHRRSNATLACLAKTSVRMKSVKWAITSHKFADCDRWFHGHMAHDQLIVLGVPSHDMT